MKSARLSARLEFKNMNKKMIFSAAGVEPKATPENTCQY